MKVELISTRMVRVAGGIARSVSRVLKSRKFEVLVRVMGETHTPQNSDDQMITPRSLSACGHVQTGARITRIALVLKTWMTYHLVGLVQFHHTFHHGFRASVRLTEGVNETSNNDRYISFAVR